MRIIIFLLSISLLFTPIVSAKEKGNIQIYCQPKVKVFINKRFKSKSKEKHKGLLIKNLSYGKYKIKLSKDKIDEYITVDLNDSLFEFYSQEFSHSEYNFEEKFPGSDEFVPVEIQPMLIYNKEPTYPDEAIMKNITGTVFVKVLISKKGDVLKVLLGKSSGNELLDKAALDVAPKNKFKPAIQNGKPVALWVTYNVDFNLKYKR